MLKPSLILLGALLLGALPGLALSADPAADKSAPAAEEPAAAATAPVFLGILKEGEKLPTATQIYAAKKAERDKAELHDALMASKDLALRIGSFAVKLMIGIAIAATVGVCIASLMILVRGRRRNLMPGNSKR